MKATARRQRSPELEGGRLVVLSGSASSARLTEPVPAPSDDRLGAAIAGQEAAVEEVLHYLYPLVRRFVAYRFASLRGEVEDVTHDIMVEVIRSLPRYRREGRVEAWALRLAFRTARRLRARRDARAATTSAADLPEHVFAVEPSDRALALDVLRALDRIGEKKRDALILTEVLGLTASEAAQVLGTFANTVQSRARHARLELGRILSEGEPPPPRAARLEGALDVAR